MPTLKPQDYIDFTIIDQVSIQNIYMKKKESCERT